MLTSAQLQTLRTDIDAQTDPDFLEFRNAGDNAGMASWYNVAGSTVVWRSSITRHEAQADGFDWTQCDNLTNGQARIWEWIFNTTGAMNPSEPGVRAGIAECWKGTAAKVAVGVFVLGKCKRNATRGEALYAAGAGTTANPSTMGFEGSITVDDVRAAMAL